MFFYTFAAMKRFAWIGILVLLAFIVAVMLLLGRKPTDDDSAFAKCKNVKDYREYVSDFGIMTIWKCFQYIKVEIATQYLLLSMTK